MDKELINKTEVETTEDDLLGASVDDLDALSVAADAAQAYRKRFLLVCDATSSMNSWWREAQTALKKAVDEIASRTHVPFQVKVVAYRDHTCDARPLEESNWSNDTQYLREFIEEIKSSGGGDFPESIGHGLRPAVQSGASMVILIGDAPGRQESTGYEEARDLGNQLCPVFALYVDDHPKTVEAFKYIAQLSGGKAMHLRDAKNMTDIFSALLARFVFQIEYQPATSAAKELIG